MKISAKIIIIIIVVQNRDPCYFIIIYKCTEVPLSLLSYQMLASTFDSDERPSYYKVYEVSTITDNFIFIVCCHQGAAMLSTFLISNSGPYYVNNTT